MVRSLFGEGPKSFGGGEDECEEEEDMLKQGKAKRETVYLAETHFYVWGTKYFFTFVDHFLLCVSLSSSFSLQSFFCS